MKPHRLHETKKARALSLVRMHLKASLGWLEGFPLAREGAGEALVWFVPGDPGRAILRVDKALLIRAGRTVRELAGEFPKVVCACAEGRAFERGPDAVPDADGEGEAGASRAAGLGLKLRKTPGSAFDEAPVGE